jgi:predicted phage terminase large subunit-like protein
VISLDCAFKAGSENDYSAATVWGTASDGYYLLRAWRGRVEFPELKRMIILLSERWNPDTVLIEDRASGQSLIQELTRATRLPVKAIRIDRDKLTRAHAVTPLIEAGKVFLPDQAPWLADYLDELAAFPSAPHDDFVDSTTQALNYLRLHPHSGLADLYDALLPRSYAHLTPYERAELVELPEGYRPPRRY